MPEYQQRDTRPAQAPRRNLTDHEMQTALQMAGEKFDATHLSLIWQGIGGNAPFTDFQRFLYFCTSKGLNPLLNEVHAEFKFSNRDNSYKMAIVTHIEAYRRLADESGNYDGQEEAFSESDGRLISCTVRVFRKDCAKSFSYTAWLSEYGTDHPSSNWTKMPHVMLRKVAEAAALRCAFPAALSGAYIGEEMGRAASDQPEQIQPEMPPAPSEPAPPAPVDPPELTALLSGIKDKYSMLDATGVMKDKVQERTGSVDLYYEILSHYKVKKSSEFQTPRPAKEFIRELWKALEAGGKGSPDDKHFEDEERAAITDDAQPNKPADHPYAAFDVASARIAAEAAQAESAAGRPLPVVTPFQISTMLDAAFNRHNMSPDDLGRECKEIARKLNIDWSGPGFGNMPVIIHDQVLDKMAEAEFKMAIHSAPARARRAK